MTGNNKPLIIAVDFDGTMVTHEYPFIGKDIGAPPVLRTLIKRGFKIILFTMRSGADLDEAVKWCTDNDIRLYGVNENPYQSSWTKSPKPYAHVYIDDASLGVPLVHPLQGRSYVDWKQVAKYFNISAKEIREEDELDEIN